MTEEEEAGNETSDAHTYAAHLQFSARDDDHAREIGARIADLVGQWQATVDARSDKPLMLLPRGYAIETAYVTDADDWSEQVGPEDMCGQCGKAGGTNRLRTGVGSRSCADCVETLRLRRYAIEDVAL